jgi:hypothetical protein
VNVNLNDKLSEKHITIINSIQESFNNSNTITFRKSINDTLYNHGKQTIPAAFDQKLDQWGLCAVGQSIKFSVILLDNSKVQGQLYHGRNNTGLYYQLMVSGFSNAKRLRDLIKSENLLSLNYEINLSDRSIIIKKAA